MKSETASQADLAAREAKAMTLFFLAIECVGLFNRASPPGHAETGRQRPCRNQGTPIWNQ